MDGSATRRSKAEDRGKHVKNMNETGITYSNESKARMNVQQSIYIKVRGGWCFGSVWKQGEVGAGLEKLTLLLANQGNGGAGVSHNSINPRAVVWPNDQPDSWDHGWRLPSGRWAGRTGTPIFPVNTGWIVGRYLLASQSQAKFENLIQTPVFPP
ncbi:hypothetical protein NMY22_g3211 [Coprinellus aureogranulatus]|nr:hypothetical protein NMY22_g3211 [Coprinellus aureogranulatus]